MSCLTPHTSAIRRVTSGRISTTTRFRRDPIPSGERLTVAATAANPGALPDVFLRPIIGFGDINISSPTGKSCTTRCSCS